MVSLILILTIWNWDSRGVIFNFGFTFLSFIIFITAILIVSLFLSFSTHFQFSLVCPAVILFLTKNAKERIWTKLDVWMAQNAQRMKSEHPDIVVYHGTTVYRTIKDLLEPTCVCNERCQTIHTVCCSLSCLFFFTFLYFADKY